MATTIITKYGSGAPAASDVVRGELAVDTENGRLYTENIAGSVVEIGLNPSGNLDVTGTVTADGLTVESQTGITLEDAGDSRTGKLFFDGGAFQQQATGSGDIIHYTTDSKTARHKISSNGDISFYEDTGTTARLFWDASAELLGLGTTAPSFTVGSRGIHIVDATSPAIRLQDSNAANSDFTIYSPDGDNSLRIYHENSAADVFTVNSSGNVGIGTTSPTEPLTVSETASGSTTQIASFVNPVGAASTGVRLWMSGTNTTTRGTFIDAVAESTSNDHTLRFGTSASSAAPTERMRIDSSGNLLVGKTSGPNYNTVGIDLTPLGELQVTGDSRNVATFNRQTTDGDIAVFRKDGVAVGSIGASGGDLLIGTGDTGIRFVDADDALVPFNTNGSGHNAIDLGKSAERFKDLYLSGGVFFGSDQDASNNTTTNGTDVVEGNIRVASTSYCFDANRANAVDGEVVRFRKQAVQVGSITVTGSTTAYNQSSDQRLKENIVDAPSASDDIDAIQVRSFDWKVDGSHQKYGMIAQELQTVAPEAVSAPEDPEEMMGVDFSKLVPMMLKEIQQLRARVAQLEGAN